MTNDTYQAPGPDHDHWADAPAAYLLRALAPDETPGFEAHLERCAPCRDEVAFLRCAADALPVAVPQIDPPPTLKSSIMAVVEREAALLRAAGPEADRPPAPAPRRRVGWWPSWFALRPVPAMMTVLVLVVGGVVAGQAIESSRNGPDRVIAGSAEIRGVSAELELREGRGRLAVTNLPSPPAGRVYQVWLDRGVSAPEPTNALFRPRADGTSSVDVPGDLRGVRQILVTDEPDGGSQVPTRTPIIAVGLS